MRHRVRAAAWASTFAVLLGVLIVAGSRNLHHFDAALVGYTFATLFATFGITYRYAMWLSRPPTRMYWRRGWQTALAPRFFFANLGTLLRRAVVEFAGNRFIFRRGRLRGLAHWCIMWGCLLAAAITSRSSGVGFTSRACPATSTPTARSSSACRRRRSPSDRWWPS